MQFSLVKIEVYLPSHALDAVRAAMTSAGAGRVGNYDSCSSVSAVRGSWRPLPGASPYDGEVGVLSEGEELKLEMRCDAELAVAAVAAARAVHPYEEPLIHVIPLWSVD